MKDVMAMRERLAAFLAVREPGRSAQVDSYEVMTGGYSRVMAKASVRWDDGTSELLVLRGDPPTGESMLDTDRDAEWRVLQALTEIGSVTMPAARYYDETAEHLGTKCIVLDCAPGPTLHAVIGDLDDPTPFRDDLVDTMAAVHRVDLDRLPTSMPRPTSWDAYVDGANAIWADAEAELAESN